MSGILAPYLPHSQAWYVL